MRISIFGLGYVGCVSAACLAELGHTIVGVDIKDIKIRMVNNGESPIVEKGLDSLIANVVKKGRLIATSDVDHAVRESDVAMICVGTPSRDNGGLELSFVEAVAEQIGTAIKEIKHYFVLVIRSTVLPGTVENTIIPIVERASGKRVGRELGICMNPEFLREGTSIDDFFSPPKTVIGESDKKSGDTIEKIYEGIDAPLFRVPIKIAEMVKYCDNTFHALKVTFANEIGSICKKLGIDSHAVMNVFCSDTKLNISRAYLKPGFAFGGSCLPKDLRALVHSAKNLNLEIPVLDSVLASNRWQIAEVVKRLQGFKSKRIGFMGLSFKGGTDDLRESPMVDVVEQLLGRGFQIRIYDKSVSIAKLIGANKQYIEEEIPHISSLIDDNINDMIEKSDVIVVGNVSDEFREAIKALDADKIVVDLVRIIDDPSIIKAAYEGICW
jgi:GDP-mannose 6-dehydrogenase